MAIKKATPGVLQEMEMLCILTVLILCPTNGMFVSPNSHVET